jgi:hypothetical protein
MLPLAIFLPLFYQNYNFLTGFKNASLTQSLLYKKKPYQENAQRRDYCCCNGLQYYIYAKLNALVNAAEQRDCTDP